MQSLEVNVQRSRLCNQDLDLPPTTLLPSIPGTELRSVWFPPCSVEFVGTNASVCHLVPPVRCTACPPLHTATQTAKSLETALASNTAGVASEVFIYPGQGHAFVNASEEGIQRKVAMGNAPHDASAVDLAWSRVDQWFSKHLA